jgi:hypothetical protein
VTLAAGSVALPALLKLAGVMEKGGQELASCDQLPIEIELGQEFVYHSIFACPVSRDQSTAGGLGQGAWGKGGPGCLGERWARVLGGKVGKQGQQKRTQALCCEVQCNQMWRTAGERLHVRVEDGLVWIKGPYSAHLRLHCGDLRAAVHSQTCGPAAAAAADNPPKLLPCNHVLCEQSIQKIARSRSRVFKCPYCPMEARPDNTRTLIFPDVL